MKFLLHSIITNLIVSSEGVLFQASLPSTLNVIGPVVLTVSCHIPISSGGRRLILYRPLDESSIARGPSALGRDCLIPER